MLAMIDNYDSFTYNLVHYFGELGEQVQVHRNDKITIAELEASEPQYLVVSPGPCDPDQAGISLAAIAHFMGKIPILGVCLGHQSIGQVLGGKIHRAKTLMHGKTSMITHNSQGVFSGLPSPFRATRYHSLAIDADSLPSSLIVTASTDDGEIMGVQHVEHAVYGVQFHPESIETENGHRLLQNFLDIK